MNIALTIDELNHYLRTIVSPRRGWGLFPYWILLGGILSGLGALLLAAMADVKP